MSERRCGVSSEAQQKWTEVLARARATWGTKVGSGVEGRGGRSALCMTDRRGGSGATPSHWLGGGRRSAWQSPVTGITSLPDWLVSLPIIPPAVCFSIIRSQPRQPPAGTLKAPTKRAPTGPSTLKGKAAVRSGAAPVRSEPAGGVDRLQPFGIGSWLG